MHTEVVYEDGGDGGDGGDGSGGGESQGLRPLVVWETRSRTKQSLALSNQRRWSWGFATSLTPLRTRGRPFVFIISSETLPDGSTVRSPITSVSMLCGLNLSTPPVSPFVTTHHHTSPPHITLHPIQNYVQPNTSFSSPSSKNESPNTSGYSVPSQSNPPASPSPDMSLSLSSSKTSATSHQWPTTTHHPPHHFHWSTNTVPTLLI